MGESEPHDLIIEDREGRLAIITRPVISGRIAVPMPVMEDASSVFDLTTNSFLKYRLAKYPPDLEEFLRSKNACLSDIPKAKSCTIGTVPVVYAYKEEQSGFYCGSGHPVSETYSKLKRLLRDVEELINRSPAGEVRNHLSNAASELRLELNKEKENG